MKGMKCDPQKQTPRFTAEASENYEMQSARRLTAVPRQFKHAACGVRNERQPFPYPQTQPRLDHRRARFHPRNRDVPEAAQGARIPGRGYGLSAPEIPEWERFMAEGPDAADYLTLRIRRATSAASPHPNMRDVARLKRFVCRAERHGALSKRDAILFNDVMLQRYGSTWSKA